MSSEIVIDEFKIEEIPLSCTWIIVGPPGSGKCLAPGTPVIMYDGNIKKVEDVKTDDLLMGDDSTPRRVLSTTHGKDNMYKVSQSRGDDYVVNEPHILSLKKDDGVIRDISVRDYLRLCEDDKKKYKGYRNPIEFNSVRGILEDGDFRKIGMWMGGSYKNKNYFDYIKAGIINESLKEYVESIDIDDFFSKIQVLKLLFKNNIPFEIKTSSLKNRREFLAGVVDTNGEVIDNSYYYVEIKNKTTSFDLKNLAESCGYHANVSINNNLLDGITYKLRIYGELDVITTRKRITNRSLRYQDSDINISYIGEGEYYGFQLDGNHRFLLGDYTVTHNTTFIENMCYYHKHRYPVARIFMGTESGYQHFSKIFHPLYVSNFFDEEKEKLHILRQKKCVMENGKGYEGNYAINILDDVSDDPKIYKTKLMRGIFKLGSQHWDQLFLLGSQYAIDMPPDIRKSTSYVALFREPEELERKKLYQNFGGLAGSYQTFCELMDQLTGDHTCLVFKKRSQSNKIEDCIFYYQTKVLGKWKFGSKEYREWAKNRYNQDYVEEITV